MTIQNKTVSFTQMKDGTKEEYELLHELEKPYLAMTADRVMDELRRHGETTLEGYKITRLQHGLQSATRAEEDGVDIDWIVGALLHDIGDGLAPQNHDRFSAEVVRPFAFRVIPITLGNQSNESSQSAPGRSEPYFFANARSSAIRYLDSVVFQFFLRLPEPDFHRSTPVQLGKLLRLVH